MISKIVHALISLKNALTLYHMMIVTDLLYSPNCRSISGLNGTWERTVGGGLIPWSTAAAVILGLAELEDDVRFRLSDEFRAPCSEFCPEDTRWAANIGDEFRPFT